MGNNNALTLSCNNNPLRYESYQFINQISENKSLMKQKHTNQPAIVIQYAFPSEEQLNDFIRRFKNQSSLEHQYYLNLFHMQIASHLNICSKQYKLYEYYNYEEHTLLKQIDIRRQTKRHFNSKEIMSILSSCVLLMSYFSKHQILHYTLHPSDIIITEDGLCKVISSRLSQFVFDFNEKRQFYYSPETLKMFKQQSITNALTNKSAVFTLAISLLNMIHLRPMHHLYNYDTYTINLDLLNQEIKKIRDQNLQKVLVKMVKIQSYQRITFTELQEMLFECIAMKDGKPKCHNEQTEKYQIAMLEESISKIHIQDDRGSCASSQLTKRTIPLKDTKCSYLPIRQSKMSRISLPQSKIIQTTSEHYFINPTQKALSADRQDNPNTNQQPLNYQSSIDLQILDEFDQPNSNEFFQPESSSRNALQQRTIENHQYNNRQYSRQSKLSSIKSQQNCYGFHHNLSSQEQKQNRSVPMYIDCSRKNTGLQGIRQYISQVLAEGRYEGYKHDNWRDGFGTFYYKEGGRYCGEWVQDRMEGRGVLYYASGKIAYQGQWKADRLQGYGTLYNQTVEIQTHQNDYTHLELISNNWIKYQGAFSDDMKKGEGILYLSNGQSYKGMFQDDQPHGLGYFINIRGQTTRGYWLMGALNTIQ